MDHPWLTGLDSRLHLSCTRGPIFLTSLAFHSLASFTAGQSVGFGREFKNPVHRMHGRYMEPVKIDRWRHRVTWDLELSVDRTLPCLAIESNQSPTRSRIRLKAQYEHYLSGKNRHPVQLPSFHVTLRVHPGVPITGKIC
ncbi:hypothetical protein C8F04DRAFT_1021745 [Mycena alexandri]|uniref:Uncharacterized protein n=1 Tax=Mycena alexandri TaxID=1745969 RepID=A0AAD6RVI5_9AGAR|nr:hypothetical protein C8F04DRAFT_1021745 [Mycena alexandri]